MDVGWRAIAQALVRPLAIVELDVAVEPVCDRRPGLVVVPLQVLVLHGAPQPLNKNVVKDPSILIRTATASRSAVKPRAVN
jgi:hypothetical protein